jgi:23S rRNA (pseudouridine1915-N3)-methyltransferase
MRIHLLSVGRRLPTWIDDGFNAYAKRLPPECRLELVEIEPARRPKAKVDEAARGRLQAAEGRRLLKAIPDGALPVALDVCGRCLSSEQLAAMMADWLAGGRDPVLLVGGADGLSADCLARAEQRWSLSPLTFPHGLVRVMLAEQLYRAWTILQGHPYHRGA